MIEVASDEGLEIGIVAKGGVIDHVVHVLEPHGVAQQLPHRRQPFHLLADQTLHQHAEDVDRPISLARGRVSRLLRRHLPDRSTVEEHQTAELQLRVSRHVEQLSVLSHEVPHFKETSTGHTASKVSQQLSLVQLFHRHRRRIRVGAHARQLARVHSLQQIGVGEQLLGAIVGNL